MTDQPEQIPDDCFPPEPILNALGFESVRCESCGEPIPYHPDKYLCDDCGPDCPACGGCGYIRKSKIGDPQFDEECERCEGTGEI
jgi:hypothetical protein